MMRHQRRTLAIAPTLALLSTISVCDGQPLVGARPTPPRRSKSGGLASGQVPRQFRLHGAPGPALVRPAAANLTEADRRKMIVRSLLFTQEDARRTKARNLLFTPEDMRRTVWRFAATQPGQKPLVAPGKPVGLQPRRR